jgi:hypothetical protein
MKQCTAHATKRRVVRASPRGRSAPKLLSKDEAWRIAAKLPEIAKRK